MAEYINRKDAQQALIDLPVDLDAEAVQRCIETVHNLPAADVRPVVRGEWIDDSRAGLIIKGPTIRCSVCAEHVFLKSMYCPACGAVMKGAER